MTDGVFVAPECVLQGVALAEFYHHGQNTRDGQWSNMLQQQQRQIDELIEYIADHEGGDEVSARDIGLD